MRVLFVTCKRGDYISSVLWDGLIEVLGTENVKDAAHSSHLHPIPGEDSTGDPQLNIGRNPKATDNYLQDTEGNFDLMVIIDAVLCDFSWEWVDSLRSRLHPGAKVVFANGLDPADNEPIPPFPVDATFRREIDPRISYKVKPSPLLMAAPSRWFHKAGLEDSARSFDVFYSGYPASPVRWESVSKMFQTKKRHQSIGSTGSAIPYRVFFDLLRRSKLGLCPPGAGSDCIRQWEVIACGAIPIMVGHPPRIRDPWFSEDEIFTCSVDDLPATIDRALSEDLTARRIRLTEKALAHHTTEARAKTMLRAVGLL